MNKIYGLMLVTFFCFILGVDNQKEIHWRGKLLTEKDATVVKNPKKPIFQEQYLSLETEFILGENKKQDEYQFPGITGFAIDSHDRIYVLVGADDHIRVFDKDGSYLRTIGGRGQGPGEFQRPMNIQILPNNNIFVHDMQRLIFLDEEGRLINEIKSTMPMAFRLTMDLNRNFIGIFGAPAEKFRLGLMKFDSGHKLVYTLATIEPLPTDMLAPGFVYDITKENQLIWGVTDKYELNVSSTEGKLLTRILKDYDPVVITEQEEREMIRKFTGGSEVLPEGMTFPKCFTPIEDISIDEDSNIFVRTNEKADGEKGYYFDMFDSSGRFLAKVAIKAVRRMPIVWKKSSLYTIEEDKDGYRTVHKYRVKKTL